MTGPTASRPLGLDALRPRARRRSLVSLTPLIDVVFILLVFFMLASSFLDWRAIQLDTPSASSGPSDQTSTTLVIGVHANGLRLDGRAATLDTIADRVAKRVAEDPDQRVLIRPAAGVPLQRAVTVLDRMATLGVTNMALSRGASERGG
jgi:biopolymer transport protein ExbD